MVDDKDKLKKKLREKLKEIFRFESEDLDFGIYRIMNYKRNEIREFIEKELIEEVRKQLELVGEEEVKEIKEEFEKIKQKIKENLGESAFENGELKEEFKNTPLGKEYYEKKKQIEEIEISEDLEREIYNHLINFFSRYYDKGDFISKRRYGKNEKYVVPYNGEEVLLYWANKDQYYIKTTEYFRRYTFEIKNKGLKVNFRVVEAEEEKGNIKSPEKKFFVLNENVFDFDEEEKELNIYFEYRGLTEEEGEKYKHGQSASQDKINEEIVKILEERIPQNSLARLIFEKDGEKTLIEKHLYKYTRRNTTDFFIHKDLKGFLERELDFYIKNEFLNLDDLKVLEESGYFDELRLYLIGVRAFRNIALKIIEFLAQIEDFQKMIWEKKKFVIDTHYVITLDKIKEYAGEEFLENILNRILSNEKQLEEWKELFGIEVKSKNDLMENDALNGKKWKKLPIDTKYFDEEFKWILLVALSKNNDLDEILDGVLIKSENWQALNLLLSKYYEKVNLIYIDPPFNTDNPQFLYKDNYKDSSWITLLENRLNLAKNVLKTDGSIYLHLDENANYLGRFLMNEKFIYRREIIWNTSSLNIAGFKSKVKNWVYATETILFYTKSDTYTFNNPRYEIPEVIKKYFKYDGEDEFGKYRLSRYGEKIYISEEKGDAIPNVWNDILSFNYATIAANESFKFFTQKPERLLKRIIETSSKTKDIVLDFFLGIGTTTAVAHKLQRKWVGIEIGDFFGEFYYDKGEKKTGVLGRMKEVLAGFGEHEPCGISKEVNWQGGGFFKYHWLEQYEDALENIEFKKSQKELYEFPDYFVKYMLEWETKDSKTFLNIDEMRDPFNYKLKIIENYQQRIVNVDLVETFNYLLGLNVGRYKVLHENGRKYVFVFGEKDGKRIAVVWRSIKDIDFEKDKEVIENELKDFELDEVYINGEALVKLDKGKGFRHIEPLFKSLMFEKVK